jgi:tetratricopeptide (TPR) repeat protein
VGLLDVFRRKGGSKRGDALKTPLTAAHAVRDLVKTGRLEEALETADRASERFPWSVAVQSAFRLLKRETLGAEIKQLRRVCEASDDPVAFTRLAGAYRDVGEYDKAVDVCRESIERFPNHEGPWYVLGRIRFERFREDWLSRDALLAIDFYEKAFDRNRSSYRTLIDLADLYAKIGARSRAIRRCEAILYFAPEDERALALLQKAMSLPQSPAKDDLEALVESFAAKQRKAASRRGRKAGDAPPPDVQLMRDPALLRDKLSWLRAHADGFRAAVGIDAEGVVCGYCGDDGPMCETLGRSLHQIFRVAFDCSLRMDIGRMRTAVFESPSGTCYMLQFGELRLGILCDAGAKLDRLESAVERLLEDELYR